MDYKKYLDPIKIKCICVNEIKLDNCSITVFYDEVFKWKWFATKLKIFSFITHVDWIDKNKIELYSMDCLAYARKNKRGLPPGIQNGIVSNNILVSENIDKEAVDFALSRPKKHYSVFELPIIVDLARKKMYYYKGDVIWGALYNSFIRNYIVDNFGIR